MRRLLFVASIAASAGGCNALLGIHEHPANDDAGSDAGADPCLGVCECKVDADCPGDHRVCDDEVTSRTCGCAAGYAPAGVGSCSFIGIVQDPGFIDPSKWIAEEGASVDPTTPAPPSGGDVGAGIFKGASYCNGTARLTQDLVMPRASRAEPLVAVLSYATTSAQMGPFGGFGAPVFGIGVAWNENLNFSDGNGISQRICLGPGQYAPETSTGVGVTMPLTLMPSFGEDCFDGTSDGLAINHFEIEVAQPGECPTVIGAIPGGDAETSDPWSLDPFGAGATVKFVDGVGEAGSRGLQIKMTQVCDGGEATLRQVPMPTSGAFGAYVEFTDQVEVELFGNLSLPRATQPNLPTTLAACVPAGQRGTVSSFTVEAFANVVGATACTDAFSGQAIFDDIRAIPDLGCGDDPAIADPGFESVLPLTNTQQQAGQSSVAKVVDPAQAHSGTTSLTMAMPFQCSFAEYFSTFIAGASAQGAGPALAFSYRTESRSHTDLFVNGAKIQTITDGQWHDSHVCTDPKQHGRDLSLSFDLEENAVNPTCGQPAPTGADTVFIDDLRVTTDPACAP